MIQTRWLEGDDGRVGGGGGILNFPSIFCVNVQYCTMCTSRHRTSCLSGQKGQDDACMARLGMCMAAQLVF